MGSRGVARGRAIAALCVCLFIVGVGAMCAKAVVASRPTGADVPTLSAVSATTLRSDFGIVLHAPSDGPRLGRSDALAAVVGSPGERASPYRVRESVLASVGSSHIRHLDGCLCWVISMVPATGTFSQARQLVHVRYMLTFVDARTGIVRWSILAGPVTAAPLGCCLHNGGGTSRTAPGAPPPPPARPPSGPPPSSLPTLQP